MVLQVSVLQCVLCFPDWREHPPSFSLKSSSSFSRQWTCFVMKIIRMGGDFLNIIPLTKFYAMPGIQGKFSNTVESPLILGVASKFSK